LLPAAFGTDEQQQPAEPGETIPPLPVAAAAGVVPAQPQTVDSGAAQTGAASLPAVGAAATPQAEAARPAAAQQANLAPAVSSDATAASQTASDQAQSAETISQQQPALSPAPKPAPQPPVATERSRDERDDGTSPASTGRLAAPSASVGSNAGTPQSAAAGGTPDAADSAADTTDRVRFVQRVAQAFATATDGGSIRLRLYPPELGSLQLEMTVRNGTLRARVETETSEARNVLLNNLPALRERLAQQNIKVDQFDVDVMGQSSGGSWQPPSDLPQNRSGQTQSPQPARTSPAAITGTPPPGLAASIYGEGMNLDVTI
jgi:flagellar hook-length control protein FliK